jgi:zinc transporter ZupT
MEVAKGNEQNFYSRNKKELDPEDNFINIDHSSSTEMNTTTSSIRQRQLNEENSKNIIISNSEISRDYNKNMGTPVNANSGQFRKIVLLIIAVTVHNIPEGLAVGVGFGASGKTKSATFQNARYKFNLFLIKI